MNLISQNDQILLNYLQYNLNKYKSMTRVNRICIYLSENGD